MASDTKPLSFPAFAMPGLPDAISYQATTVVASIPIRFWYHRHGRYARARGIWTCQKMFLQPEQRPYVRRKPTMGACARPLCLRIVTLNSSNNLGPRASVITYCILALRAESHRQRTARRTRSKRHCTRSSARASVYGRGDDNGFVQSPHKLRNGPSLISRSSD